MDTNLTTLKSIFNLLGIRIKKQNCSIYKNRSLLSTKNISFTAFPYVLYCIHFYITLQKNVKNYSMVYIWSCYIQMNTICNRQLNVDEIYSNWEYKNVRLLHTYIHLYQWRRRFIDVAMKLFLHIYKLI